MNHLPNLLLRWAAASLLTFGAFISLAQDQERNDSSVLPSNIAFWNLPDGAKLRLGKGTVGVLEYSPDGKTLAAGGSLGVWLYDAKTGAETGFLQGRKGTVLSIDYAPDSKTILIGSTDRWARIWDAKTGELLQTLKDMNGYASRPAAFAPDGKTAAVGMSAGIYIWDIETGQLIRKLTGGRRGVLKVRAFAYSPDGKLIANENSIREIHIWDAQTGKRLHILEQYASRSLVVFSPDGKTLAAGFSRSYNDWPINIYNPQTGKMIRSVNGHTRMITAVMYSPDSSLLVSGSKDGSIKVWDAESGALRTMIGGGDNVVTQTAYSPDGKTLVQIVKSADYMRQKYKTLIRIWDAESGALLHAIDGPDTFTASLTFSPNGDSFAFTVPSAHAIWVCGAREGKALRTIRDPKFGVSMVKYSPDGKILASGNTAGALQLWNPDTGKNIRTIRGHTDPIEFIAFSRDSRIIATGGERDGAVYLWNLNTGENLHTLQGHAANAFPAGFSMDGKRLVTFSEDNVVRVWSVDSGAQSQAFGEGKAPVWAYDYSPERKEIALAYKESGGVSLWSVEKGAVVQTLEGHTEQVESLTYSPDGRLLVSAGGDAARIWNLDTGETLHMPVGQDDWAEDISFFPNNDTIATRGAESFVSLWSADSGEFLRAVPENVGRIYAMAFAPDGKTFASLSHPNHYGNNLIGGNIDIWSARSGARLRTIRGHTSDRRSVDFSPDGKAVASAGMEGVLSIQDANTGETIHEIDGNTWILPSVRYSPDGKTLISVGGAGIQMWDAQTGQLMETFGELPSSRFSAFSADGSLLAISSRWDYQTQIWDLKTRKLRNSFGNKLVNVLCASFSPYGTNLATGSRDGELRIWNAETGALVQAPIEHPYEVSAVAYSPDGERIATGCADSVRIWVAGRGSFLISEMGASEVKSVAYSPDGKILASGSLDGTVNLWDGETGKRLIKTFTGHTDAVNALSFSRDGKTLASASLDGTVLLWDLSNLPSSAPPP